MPASTLLSKKGSTRDPNNTSEDTSKQNIAEGNGIISSVYRWISFHWTELALVIILALVATIFIVVLTNSGSEISGMNTQDECRKTDLYNCTLQFEETQLTRLDNNYTAQTTEILESFINSSKSKIDVVGFLPLETDEQRNREAERFFKGLIKKAKANVGISIILNTYETANTNLKRILNKIRNSKNVKFTIVEKKIEQTLLIFDDTNMYLSVAPIGQITTSRIESCILFTNCSCIVKQAKKILHEFFPNIQLSEIARRQKPLNVCCNDKYAADFNLTTSFPTSSKQVISAEGAFTWIVSQAKEFIYIFANEYDPNISTNSSTRVYWPLIEDQLRSAASTNVTIRILTSRRRNKNPYLESLSRLPKFKVKQLIIPSNSNDIDLNQNRYIVTERGIYYGMPKLSGDDFNNSLTIGFVSEDTTLRETIVDSFKRHWKSNFAKPL